MPDGRIAIVELDRTPWYLFLSAHRTDPAVIRREMEASGYVLSDRHDVLEYQSFQEFKKSAAKEDTSK